MRMTKQQQRRGAAAVEFAVVAPVLFALFFGMVEFGRAMQVLGVVTNTARAGARAGAVTSGTYSSISTAVTNSMSKAAIGGTPTIVVQVNGVTVSDDNSFKTAAVSGSTISVQVSVPYKDVSLLPNGGFFLSETAMTETAVMRREG